MNWFKKKEAKQEKSSNRKISMLTFDDILNDMSIGDEIYTLQYPDRDFRSYAIHRTKLVGVAKKLDDDGEIRNKIMIDDSGKLYTVSHITANMFMFKTREDAFEYYRKWLKDTRNADIKEACRKIDERYKDALSRIEKISQDPRWDSSH